MKELYNFIDDKPIGGFHDEDLTEHTGFESKGEPGYLPPIGAPYHDDLMDEFDDKPMGGFHDL